MTSGMQQAGACGGELLSSRTREPIHPVERPKTCSGFALGWKHSIGTLLQARQRAAEDGVFLQRARKRQRTLNTADDILGERPCGGLIDTRPYQRAIQRRDPPLEIELDRLGEAIPRLIERERTEQANPPARAEIGIDRLPHLRDRGVRLIALQGFEHFADEPLIDMAENLCRHPLFPFGKEVIEASL